MVQALTPDTLVYGLTPAGDPQVSPDGASIVYTLSKTDRETKKASSQVWRCAVDGNGATRLTWTGERNRGARWAPDGQATAFVSEPVKKEGLFVMPIGAAPGGGIRP